MTLVTVNMSLVRWAKPSRWYLRIFSSFVRPPPRPVPISTPMFSYRGPNRIPALASAYQAVSTASWMTRSQCLIGGVSREASSFGNSAISGSSSPSSKREVTLTLSLSWTPSIECGLIEPSPLISLSQKD